MLYLQAVKPRPARDSDRPIIRLGRLSYFFLHMPARRGEAPHWLLQILPDNAWANTASRWPGPSRPLNEDARIAQANSELVMRHSMVMTAFPPDEQQSSPPSTPCALRFASTTPVLLLLLEPSPAWDAPKTGRTNKASERLMAQSTCDGLLMKRTLPAKHLLCVSGTPATSTLTPSLPPHARPHYPLHRKTDPLTGQAHALLLRLQASPKL